MHTNNTHTQFQSNMFVFGCTITRKPGKGDDATFFEIPFLAFLIVVNKNKWHFWSPQANLHKIGVILEENI